VPPLVLWEVLGLLASSGYPSFMPLPPVSLPILPYFLKTNMDTLEGAEGSPVAEFIDASLLLHDPPDLQPLVDRLVCGPGLSRTPRRWR
jgi:hypothetical protein